MVDRTCPTFLKLTVLGVHAFQHAARAGITDMCFAFTTTEQQLTARSYPAHDITPPAMTVLVERGSEKRTGIRNRRPLRAKPPVAAPLGTGAATAASTERASTATASSRPSGQTPRAAPLPATAVAAAEAGAAKSSRSTPNKKKGGTRPKQSPKSAARADAALLADPRPKPTGSKSKAKT